MAAEERKPSLARIQQRIRVVEGPPSLAMLQNARQGPAPEREVAHIDLQQLQEAGIPTPLGVRTRVMDEYRLIKRSILRIAAARESPDHHLNVVMVTSSQPGEGKTFTALSLAISVVAEKGVPVLLADLDIVKQDTSRRLGICRQVGLIDLLADSKITLAQVLVQTDVPGLTVLPAGSDRPLAHELMAGPKMRELLDHLSSAYRNGLVILDLPPVLASADASVIASNVGQVILVVEANRTGRTSVEQTVSLLQGCKRVFFVLNKVEASQLIEQYGTYYGEPYTYATPSGAPSFAERVTSSLRNWLVRTKSG
jgi:protein-tyrosine kinase